MTTTLIQRIVYGFSATVLLCLIVACGGGNTETPSEPEFSAFSVTPNEVCLNQGVDLVRVNFTVDLHGREADTWCINLRLNGELLNQGAVNNVHEYCLDDGNPGEMTFTLSNHFGTNIPSQITIEGTIVQAITGVQSEGEDSQSSTTITTNPDCPPPDIVP